MTKKIFIFTVLILFNKIIAQEKPFPQKELFESGQKYLKKGKLEIAIYEYYMSNKYGENSDIKKSAQQKIDSLLPIIQKDIIKQWKGNWKIKELNFDPYPGKFSNYICFEEDKIVFYKKDSNGKKMILRSEQINFLRYDSIKIQFDVHNVIFKNSEVWSFKVRKRKLQKRLYPELVLDSSGAREVLLDERGIIMDKKMRKRAYKREIYTFYIKSK